jgi:hypothetical protein
MPRVSLVEKEMHSLELTAGARIVLVTLLDCAVFVVVEFGAWQVS